MTLEEFLLDWQHARGGGGGGGSATPAVVPTELTCLRSPLVLAVASPSDARLLAAPALGGVRPLLLCTSRTLLPSALLNFYSVS